MRNKEFKEISVQVTELQIGMHVIRLDRPWNETTFLLQSFIIQSTEEIYELQTQCLYVYVQVIIEDFEKFEQQLIKNRKSQETKSKQSSNADSDNPISGRRIKYLNKVSFEASIESSQMSFKHARDLAHSILDGVRVGHAINMNHCRDVIENVVNSVLANPDALRFLTQIKNKDKYTAEHCMNVSILSATFARHLGRPIFEIKSVAMAGLLHDVGKAKIPLEVLNKPGKFTANEARVMSNHAVFGRDILMAIQQRDRSSVDVAHSHHERMDGQGYPRGLDSAQIPYFSKIVAIPDAYDAMTSNRVYGDAKTSFQALEIIHECAGTQFDEHLAEEFIKCIGIYSIGSIVELKNGEVGVVLHSDIENRLKPKVLLVRDVNKRIRYPEKVIRLDRESSDTLQILHELPNGSYGIKIEELVERGLKLG